MNTETCQSAYSTAVNLDAACLAANAKLTKAYAALHAVPPYSRDYPARQARCSADLAAYRELSRQRDDAWKAAKAARA
jgi:hypothetical protein